MVVTIDVPDFARLYEHIQRPNLEKLILEEQLPETAWPISNVWMITQSDGLKYSLKAQILYDGRQLSTPLAKVREGIEAKFRVAEKWAGSFVVGSPFIGNSVPENRTYAVLGQWGVEVMEMHSSIFVLGGAGLMPMTTFRPLKGEGHFSDDFNFFKTVAETAMTAICKNYNPEGMPDVVLTVKV